MSTYLSDYDYFLPEELIGQKPREPRDSAKLMLIDRKNESIEHKNFYNIIDYLQKGDILVRNATKVIPARIFGHKDTGGVLEILLIKRISLDTWECLLKPAKKLKLGQKLYIGENKELIAELLEIKEDGNRILKFYYEGSFEEILDKLYDFMKSDKYTIEDRQKFLYMEKEILDIKEEKGITLEIKKLLILEKKENIETNLKRIEVNNKEVEFLYDDYLKEAYYINHQNIKSIREFSSKEDIKSEIEILRKKGEEISKREYIKEQLDEVMLKHRYNVIDSEHIEKVKEDNRLLYEIDDSTGIDVFLSETQTQMVTLKIVGIGFDEEITERESDRLYEEQCNFCSMFPELVEELRIRGVILNEVRYNEANKKYNSKIKIKKNDKTKNKKKKSRENINNKKYREIKR